MDPARAASPTAAPQNSVTVRHTVLPQSGGTCPLDCLRGRVRSCVAYHPSQTLIAVLLIAFAAKYERAITSVANNAPALVITAAEAASTSEPSE